MNLLLNIVEPEKLIYSEKIKKIQILGEKGELGIYPGHLQLLSFIRSGVVYFLNQDKKKCYIYLSGGLIEVQPRTINILADFSFKFSKLDMISIKKLEKTIRKKIKKSCIQNQEKILKNLSYELQKIHLHNTLKNNY
ncbi:MAG: ATP synthase F1 subunit epsilon [Buchnera aphidicola (Nurudea shiraii)]